MIYLNGVGGKGDTHSVKISPVIFIIDWHVLKDVSLYATLVGDQQREWYASTYS